MTYIIIVTLSAPLIAIAAKRQRTTLKRLKPRQELLADSSAAMRHMAPAPGMIALSGYDKPVNSRVESLFVTNHYDSTAVDSLLLTLRYVDLHGRQLHSRSVWVGGTFPAGATRQVTFPTWDKQHSFLYRHSAPTRKQHTTYDVSVTVDSIAIPAR